MKYIAWFEEVGRNDSHLVGGKGANLGELTRAGLPVPPGFIVTTGCYFSFLNESQIRPRIEDRLVALPEGDHGLLQQTAGEIKEMLHNAAMPPQVADHIMEACKSMSAAPVAVRSSATAEDLAGASFAGQQSTFLNVPAGSVVRSVQACWASLFEPQAIAYRARRGYQHMDEGMAVVVQQMVQSRRSGVMFTVHPVSGDRDKIVIEAVYGLGEACVSGAVTPDFYVIDKPSLSIDEKTTSEQERQLIRSDNAAPGDDPNTWVTIQKDRARLQKLTDEEIVTLGELGRRVEEHYGAPQDIEWAEEEGTFFIVQARPVTTAD